MRDVRDAVGRAGSVAAGVMHDAIVIGARCAGATTALVLAREGLDVLLVDRASFPSEIPHGHFIHQHGPRRLAELGLLDRVLRTGCPRRSRRSRPTSATAR